MSERARYSPQQTEITFQRGKKPLNPLRATVAHGYSKLMTLHLPTNGLSSISDLADPHFRKSERRELKAVINNEIGTLYMPQIGREQYGNRPIQVEGIENIPPEGPIILIINHYDRGPHSGMWAPEVVSNIIADNVSNGWERRYRFTLKGNFAKNGEDKKESENGEKKNPLDPLIKITNVAIQPVKQQISKQIADPILENFAQAFDCIQIDKKGSGFQAARTIRDGDVLGVMISGNAEYYMSRGIPEVGDLIKMGKRMGATILPVGVRHEGEKLIVNFGPKITIPDGLTEKQDISDYASMEVCKLLPPDMHGEYSGKVSGQPEITPLNLTETAAMSLYWGWVMARNLPDFEWRALIHTASIMKDVSKGVKRKNPIAKEKEIRYPNYKTRIIGEKNLPQKGPFTGAAHHPRQNPDVGWFAPFVLADAIANKLINGQERRIRVVIDSKKKVTDAFGKRFQAFADRTTRHILKNAAFTLDLIPEDKPRKMAETLSSGGIVVEFPAKAGFVFSGDIPPMVGKFAQMTSERFNAPIVPMGIWYNRKEKEFVVNIGKPIYFDHDADPQESSKRIADAITELLPPNMQPKS